MILCGWPLHEPPISREQRIAAAEDRAEQAAFDVARERTGMDRIIADCNRRLFEIQAEYEAAERADVERYGS